MSLLDRLAILARGGGTALATLAGRNVDPTLKWIWISAFVALVCGVAYLAWLWWRNVVLPTAPPVRPAGHPPTPLGDRA